MDWSFWDVIWTTLVVFVWITFLIIFFNVIVDLFRDPGTSKVKKVLWLVLLAAVPFLGVLIYVIARGDGMAERAMRSQVAQAERMRAAVGEMASTATPADQIARAKQLMDDGTITNEEFEKLKAKALA